MEYGLGMKILFKVFSQVILIHTWFENHYSRFYYPNGKYQYLNFKFTAKHIVMNAPLAFPNPELPKFVGTLESARLF